MNSKSPTQTQNVTYHPQCFSLVNLGVCRYLYTNIKVGGALRALFHLNAPAAVVGLDKWHISCNLSLLLCLSPENSLYSPPLASCPGREGLVTLSGRGKFTFQLWGLDCLNWSNDFKRKTIFVDDKKIAVSFSWYF